MDQVEHAVGSLQITENDIISQSTDLFSPPSKEMAMMDGGITGFRPLSMEESGPFTFVIPSLGAKYMALNMSRLYIKAKVAGSDGADLVATNKVSIVNLFGGSFQNYVVVKVDGQEITGLSNTYMHYKTYVETILSYGYDARTSHLQTCHFSPDEVGKFDNVAGKGFTNRAKIIETSKVFEVMCPIHSDFMQSDRLFPPGHELSITINRNPDSFLLLCHEASPKYKIKILDMRLYIKHVTLTPNVTSTLLSRSLTEPIRFPINKTIITRHAFSSGLTTATISNLIRGSLPKSLIFFMTEEDSENSMKKNPYNFQHFNLQSALVRANGKEYPSEKYNLNFNDGEYMRLFRDFYDNIGVLHDDTGNIVDFEGYKGGYCFIAFDFSPDMCNGFHWHFNKIGSIDAEFVFSQALSSSIAIYALAIYNAQLILNPKSSPNVEY